jgi:hypothetical protein
MTLRVQLTRVAVKILFVCIASWLCAAETRVARAGFDLKLDSLRQNGDHYSVDVLFHSSDVSDLAGIYVTLKSDNEGLVFLNVAQPDQGGIFGDDANYDPLPQAAPSHGTAGELWSAFVVTLEPPFPHTQQGPAFRVDFTVPGPGQYKIDFVTDPDFPDTSTYLVYFPEPPSGGSDALESAVPVAFDSLDSSLDILVGTPEPSSLVLLLTAVGGLGAWKWRRSHSRSGAESPSSPVE